MHTLQVVTGLAELVEALDIPDAVLGELGVSFLHLADSPAESACRLPRVADYGHLEMGNAVIYREFDHLGVYHQQLNFVRAGVIKNADYH